MTRDRGSYGPLDRDRHFIVGWGADHLAARAYGHTVGAVVRPVLPAIDIAVRSDRAARRLWIGTSLMGGRGEAQRPLTEIGQELFHTVADRTRALATLSTGFKALANDLAVWQTANQNAPDAAATAQWLAADVTPTLDEWRSFVEHESGSWWTKVATSWETFEEWWDRLRQLRALARAHGVMLQSVEPPGLPKTIWQKSAEGKGSEAAALLGVLKIGTLAALGVIGMAGLFAVLRDLRKPRLNDQEALRQILQQELRLQRTSAAK